MDEVTAPVDAAVTAGDEAAAPLGTVTAAAGDEAAAGGRRGGAWYWDDSGGVVLGRLVVVLSSLCREDKGERWVEEVLEKILKRERTWAQYNASR
jgi:hypothetical protein